MQHSRWKHSCRTAALSQHKPQCDVLSCVCQHGHGVQVASQSQCRPARNTPGTLPLMVGRPCCWPVSTFIFISVLAVYESKYVACAGRSRGVRACSTTGTASGQQSIGLINKVWMFAAAISSSTAHKSTNAQVCDCSTRGGKRTFLNLGCQSVSYCWKGHLVGKQPVIWIH